MEYISKSQKDTLHFAENYAGTLGAGDIVLLKGDLGAGKTILAKGIVSALGSADNVISPTFTIVNQYNSTPTVFHFDFYRIVNESELVAIGIEEYLYSGAICLIEWPERAPNLLKNLKTKTIEIIKTGDNSRVIKY